MPEPLLPPERHSDPRCLHYGQFYRHPQSAPVEPDRPVLLIHGNCQAEAMRVLFELRYPEMACIRMVPAHELEPDDVPYLQAWLRRAQYVVSQPIQVGYRGLPVGMSELFEQAPQAQTVVAPVMYWRGLHPTLVNVRSDAGDPPLTPYHDLRTIAQALGYGSLQVTDEYVAQVRSASEAQLRKRTQAANCVDVVDDLTRPGHRSVHVINHPSNVVLQAAVDALAHRLGLPSVPAVDPGRVLLSSVLAPIPAAAARAAQLTDEMVGDSWILAGETVPDGQVQAAHVQWYAEHPQVLRVAEERHAHDLRLLRETGSVG